MSKKITFSEKARLNLANGVEKLANAVTATLGPSGRNVILEQKQGNPVSTKDGVTVARSIELENKVENIGAQIVKQASIKTGDQAGDGTTTSTLLAQSILNEGLDKIQAGSNVVDIKNTKKLVKEMSQSAPIDVDKVAKIKEAISSGKYPLDLDKLSHALMQAYREMKS